MRAGLLFVLAGLVLAACSREEEAAEAPEAAPPAPAPVRADIKADDPDLAGQTLDLADACGLEEMGRNEWGTGIADSGLAPQQISQDGALIRVWSASPAEPRIEDGQLAADAVGPAWVSVERTGPARLYATYLEGGEVTIRYDGAAFACDVVTPPPEPDPCVESEPGDYAARPDSEWDSTAIREDIVIKALGATPGCVNTNARRATCRLDGPGVIFTRVADQRRVFEAREGERVTVKIRDRAVSCGARSVTP